MDEKTLSKHLQEQLRIIQKRFQRKWFTAHDAIILTRTDWTIKKLVEAGALEAKYVGQEKAKSLYHVHIYRAQECKHKTFSSVGFDQSELYNKCLYCGKIIKEEAKV